MSLLKNRPKWSQTYFWSKLIHNLFLQKKLSKNVGWSCNFQKNPPGVNNSQKAKIRPIWDRCLIFKIFSPKIFAKNWRFWHKTKLIFWKKLITTLVFKKNANFFRQKLGKIAENCDHNIDPWPRVKVICEQTFRNSISFLNAEIHTWLKTYIHG
jgi:hypothetical protein